MSDQQKKQPKKKGPFRTEAIIPILVVIGLCYLYFTLFFDLHLRKSIEWVGYQVVGAQVDVGSLDTSFIRGTFRMRGLEVTNPDQPAQNMVKIGDIRFGVLWDGLLRARLIVNEMAVEGIEIASPRKSPGRVKPPEPVKADDGKPSQLEQEVNKAKDRALEKAQQEYSGNMMGDLAAMLSGSSAGDQLGKIEGALPSKAKIKEFETVLAQKQEQWNQRLKNLPQAKEIQSLGERLGKVQTSNFKSPQELQNSIQQIDAILKEADAKYKAIQSASSDLSSDVQNVDRQLKEINDLIQKDIRDLEARFRLPKLDANSMARAMFMQYLSPYMAKVNHYKAMVDKYLPPKFKRTKDEKEARAQEVALTPHPRAKGVTYEFGRPRAYPLFWVKKIRVTSQAGASANSGDVDGQILDITSNQLLTEKPTVASLKGNFPGLGISGFLTSLSIDNRQSDSRVDLAFDVDSYAIAGRDLVQSPDVQIAFNSAVGSIRSKAVLTGLKVLDYRFDNNFKKVDYKIAASNQTVSEVLTAIMTGIPVVTLEAWGKGELPAFPVNINSNLGPALAKGFERQIQKKIDEARAKLNAFVNEQIGKERAKIEAQVNQLKTQVEGEVKKLMDQINGQKAQGEAKIASAKKDAEDRERKRLEAEAKKALGAEGEKKVDELRKRLGF